MIVRVHANDLNTLVPLDRQPLFLAAARQDGDHWVLRGDREQIEAIIGPIRTGPTSQPILRPSVPLHDVSMCVLRGDQVGEAECRSCLGHVRAKVYACARHTQCTLFTKPLDGVRCCHGCEDFTPPAEPADPGRQA